MDKILKLPAHLKLGLVSVIMLLGVAGASYGDLEVPAELRVIFALIAAALLGCAVYIYNEDRKRELERQKLEKDLRTVSIQAGGKGDKTMIRPK